MKGKKMINKMTMTLTVIFALMFGVAMANNDNAPIGVTQERLLDSGSFETFVSFEDAKFNNQENAQLTQFGGLLGVTDNWTIGASSYVVNRDGEIGDIFVYGTTQVGSLFGFDIIPSLGLSIPVNYENARQVANLPIPNLEVPFTSLSSGTVDFVPAVSVIGELGPFEAGAQYKGTFRLDENDDNFAYGDVNTLAAWVSTETAQEGLVIYGAGELTYTGDITGLDLGNIVTSSEVLLVGAGAKMEVYGFDVKGEAYVPVYEDFSSSISQFNDVRTFRLSVQRTF